MKPIASLLLFATLLSAAPRHNNPNQTIVVPATNEHHTHRKLWVTLGILAASGIATGAVLASEQRHGWVVTSRCFQLDAHYCVTTGQK